VLPRLPLLASLVAACHSARSICFHFCMRHIPADNPDIHTTIRYLLQLSLYRIPYYSNCSLSNYWRSLRSLCSHWQHPFNCRGDGLLLPPNPLPLLRRPLSSCKRIRHPRVPMRLVRSHQLPRPGWKYPRHALLSRCASSS
jgi:hypothetical protein